MMRKSLLITGANRGIGLGLVKRYLSQGWLVHATSRSLETAVHLQDLASHNADLIIHSLDVTNYEQFDQLATQLPSLDLVINNAGYYGPKGYGFGQTDV